MLNDEGASRGDDEQLDAMMTEFCLPVVERNVDDV